VKVATPAELFERAKNAYTFGDYAQAVRLFDGLLNPKVLLAETRDIEEALELLGIGAFYEGDRGRSREAFLRLLSLHPEHQLDPLLVRPEVVSFFSAISTELADRLDELRKRREVQAAWEAEQRRRSGPVVVRRELETPRWLGVVPFGVPQYLRDDVAWGTVFATGQALTALASVVAFSWARGRPGDDGLVSATDRALHEDVLAPTARWTGVAFLGLVAWGIADGLLRWKGSTRLVEETRISTAAPRPRQPEAPKPPTEANNEAREAAE